MNLTDSSIYLMNLILKSVLREIPHEIGWATMLVPVKI